MPEPKYVGKQIKISEKIVKNNNVIVKNAIGGGGHNNFLRNNKVEAKPGPRIVHIKK
jgi:hypothetical protein